MKRKIESGIYYIQNIEINKCYIGQSIHLSERLDAHKKLLLNNKHQNELLQNDYNQFGEKYFIFIKIETCERSILNEREKYWISFYDSFNNGYNKTHDGKPKYHSQKPKDIRKERRCLECGDVFKYTGNKQLRCEKHIYVCKGCGIKHDEHKSKCYKCREESKYKMCVSCGIKINKISNNTFRCGDCATKDRRERQKIRMREIRAKSEL